LSKRKVSLAKVFKTIIWPRRGLLAVGMVLILINRFSGLVLPGASKVLIDDVIAKKLFSVLQKNEITTHLNSSVTKIESDDDNPEVYLDNGEILKADYIYICFL